ncbi:putative integral membrane protein [Theileria parva strain Muguga]|uniref:Uncharacterized protein n=1 Tax=Theileria parva TaxID=5875 RepID=Q4N2K8_THEPA|nr:putative integral membrane protein [Theileria parva strain Muguga]EAN31693.1 putative integral membrane protein [Theileria parva strain Muguga]|eukprot:XP_763976.1 hypothetical protein [Theileria parva strain Muguga]
MDNSNVAYQRKNHVLSDSSNRLKTLVKGDHEDDEDELKSVPALDTSKKDSNALEKKKPDTKVANVDDEDEVVEEGDPNRVRLCGYLQLHLYFFSLLFGGFVCYFRHHEAIKDTYPRFLKNFYLLLKRRNAHVFAEHGFKLWTNLSEKTKKTIVRYFSYGTIFLNLYPVLTSPSKPRKNKDGEVIPDPQREAQVKLNKTVIKYGSSFFRTISATLFCGLLGYDLAYNLPYLKALFTRK